MPPSMFPQVFGQSTNLNLGKRPNPFYQNQLRQTAYPQYYGATGYYPSSYPYSVQHMTASTLNLTFSTATTSGTTIQAAWSNPLIVRWSLKSIMSVARRKRKKKALGKVIAQLEDGYIVQYEDGKTDWCDLDGTPI